MNKVVLHSVIFNTIYDSTQNHEILKIKIKYMHYLYVENYKILIRKVKDFKKIKNLS